MCFATCLWAAGPADAQWISPVSGNWSVPTNWASVPPGNGGVAVFQDELTGQSSTITVTLDLSLDVAQLTFRSGYSFNVASAPGYFFDIQNEGLNLRADYTIVSSPARYFTSANDISATISGAP
jgi:hypothetical protein